MVADRDLDREIRLTLPEGDDDTPPWYVPEGHYVFRVAEATRKEGPKADYIEFGLETYYQGVSKLIAHRCTLSPKYTFSLKKMLKSIGLPSSGRITLDLDVTLGRWLEADVIDKEFNNKIGSEVTEVYPLEGRPPTNWPPLGSSQEEEGEDSFFGGGQAHNGNDEEDDPPF